MNKFLLHGGDYETINRTNLLFFREMCMVKNVLIIPFACSSYQTCLRYEYPAKRFEQLFTFNNLSKLESASYPTADFEKQIMSADLIFVEGGNGDFLQAEMERWMPVVQARLSKGNLTIAGFSAGANMWSAYYYSNDNQDVCSGFGILPIKTFCHYSTEKFKKLNQLINHKPDLPVIPLTDDGYVCIQI